MFCSNEHYMSILHMAIFVYMATQQMASGGLPVFPTFSVHADPDTTSIRWKKWMYKLEDLFVVLDIDSDKKRKATLLHYEGDEVFDIYHSFTDQQKGIGATTTTEDGSTKWVWNNEKVANRPLHPQKNTSYEILKFRRALQNPDENLDAYHARLRTLASTCDFENTDREILAQILQEYLSSKLRIKAPRENSSRKQVLDQARAIEFAHVRAIEMEQKEIHALSSYNWNENDKRRTHRNNNCSSGKCTTNSSNDPSRYQQHDSRCVTSKPQAHGGYKKDGGQTCHYCGYSPTHPTCPARVQECRNCHKTNHFARVCNSKPVRQICSTHSLVSPSTSSDESVFMIIPPTLTKTPKVTALVNDSPVTFILDTGASVNIISGRVYNGLKHRPAIHCTTTWLFAYRSQQAIPFREFIDTTMKFQEKCYRTKIFVVDDESALLGLQNLLSAYSAEALGMITFNFTFHVWVSIPDGFPSRFDGKMGKISGIIINLHICTFSKLDLSNTYHQLELGEFSKHITTFATHAGLFRNKRLLFGVNAASELFQKAISDLLKGIPDVKNLSGDIIIYGRDQISHDSGLRSTLERLQNAGARQNREKCLFSVR